MIATQLRLEPVAGGARKVLRLRRPHVAPVLKRLAEHVYRVHRYQPYPDLLAVAAEALTWTVGTTTAEAIDAARKKVIRLPRHMSWGGRTEVTVGDVVDHLQLGGFPVQREERVWLDLAVAGGRA